MVAKLISLVCHIIGVGEVVNIAECEQRPELHGGSLGSFEKLVIYEKLVSVRAEQKGLAEHDVADFVGNLRHRSFGEVNHILVAPRLVNVSVAMNSKIELLATHGN